jgi:hypothetical protein
MASVTVRRGDLYAVLGVAPSATPVEITTAFRSRAKILHPDRNPAATEQFKELTLAYRTLSRPRARAAYDDHHRPRPAAPAAAPSGHDPLFRTPGRARAAVWSGLALFLLGLAFAATLLVLDTGGAGETVTLWIAAAKLLVGGPVLTGAGLHRLRRLATEQ